MSAPDPRPAGSGVPEPVTPSATPRVPRPRLTLLHPARQPHPAARPSGRRPAGDPPATGRRAALDAFLAEPESLRTREALFRTLDGIDGEAADPIDGTHAGARGTRHERPHALRLVR